MYREREGERTPEICRGSQSSTQMSSDQYIRVKKLSNLGEAPSKRIRGNNHQSSQKRRIVPSPTSPTGKPCNSQGSEQSVQKDLASAIEKISPTLTAA